MVGQENYRRQLSRKSTSGGQASSGSHRQTEAGMSSLSVGMDPCMKSLLGYIENSIFFCDIHIEISQSLENSCSAAVSGSHCTKITVVCFTSTDISRSCIIIIIVTIIITILHILVCVCLGVQWLKYLQTTVCTT